MAKRELSDFEKEFAARRAAGEKTFKYKGTTYTTETKEEEDTRKAAARKTTPAPSVPGRPRGGDASEQAPAPSPTPEPTRKTKLPAGSLLGRIARSQGAVSEGPEEKTVSPTDFSSAERLAEEEARRERVGKKIGRVMGTQAMRDEESYKKGGSVKPRGWGGARGGKSCKIC